jgi:tetratricopeptide (TPR) repeat protein
MLGKIYKQKGDFKSAIEVYEALVELDPYEADNFYQLGFSYQMVQRLQEACKSYDSALRLQPDNVNANMNIGLVYLALGDVPRAVKYTKKAAELKPDSSEAQANYAISLDSSGEYAAAEKAYRKSLELAPSQAGTLVNYGNNLLSQGKWNDAIDVFQMALKRENSAYLHKRLGDAEVMSGKNQEAIKEYRVAMKMNPKYFSAMNELAQALLVQYQTGMELDEKMREEALGLWRQSLELSPRQPKVKAALEEWDKKMFGTAKK